MRCDVLVWDEFWRFCKRRLANRLLLAGRFLGISEFAEESMSTDLLQSRSGSKITIFNYEQKEREQMVRNNPQVKRIARVNISGAREGFRGV